MKQLFLLIASFSILGACGNSSGKPTAMVKDSTVSEVEVKKIPDFRNNRLNQTARLIAGIANPADTMFRKLTGSSVWQNYAAESDKVWTEYFANNAPLYNWVKSDILPTTSGVSEIYYPFSGPDFLYGNLIYPDAENTYMFGLEEIGSVPDFDNVTVAQLEPIISFYKKSIGEVLKYSFYRTLGMKEYLHNANIDGVTPVLMLFLAKSGKQISQVNFLTLNTDGSTKVVEGDAQFKKLTNRGVEIKYYNGKDDVERRLVFFTGNIADGALEANTAYKNYYKSLRPEGSFSKSATYLMHKSYFSEVRNVILNNCKVVVSDDSGVAFRFFDPKTWNVKLFGSYTRPIPLFGDFFEADLLEAYNAANAKPLTFRIGYSYPSNMRLVTRK